MAEAVICGKMVCFPLEVYQHLWYDARRKGWLPINFPSYGRSTCSLSALVFLVRTASSLQGPKQQPRAHKWLHVEGNILDLDCG